MDGPETPLFLINILLKTPLVESPPSWSRGNNSFRPCERDPRLVKLPTNNKQNSRISTTDRPRSKKQKSTSSHAFTSSWIERFLRVSSILYLSMYLSSIICCLESCMRALITIAGSETRARARSFAKLLGDR